MTTNTVPHERSQNPDFELPILDPFPVPTISTALVQKGTPETRLDLSLSSTSASSAVMITRIGATSPLQGTTVTEGSEILAVNGHAVYNAGQANKLLKAYTKIELTTLHPQQRPASPFVYVEVAPTTRINPGVSFEACCNDTMVMVGQVLVRNNGQRRRTRLRRGDLVLAVQGQVVWKVQHANQSQIAAARQSQALVLYCVDMQGLRRHIAMTQGVLYRPPSHPTLDPKRVVQKITPLNEGGTMLELRERDCIFHATVNPTTLLYQDDTPWNRRIKNVSKDSKSMTLKISYARVCVPTFEYINQCLSQQIQAIQTKVIVHAWKALMKETATTTTDATSIPMATATTYAVPSAPVEPLEYDNTFASSLPQAQAFLVEDVDDE